jgi:pimeloyl-ACP methyl ester carboxylesterase
VHAEVSEARVAFRESDVEDLRRRLGDRMLPAFPFDDSWRFGSGRGVVLELVELWRNRLDGEALAARLNEFEQVDVRIAGVSVRALHLRGERPDALPIVITHGWPSTVLEIVSLAQALAQPTVYGGSAEDAFHVVVPALPGFPLSEAPKNLGEYTAAHTADRWAALMNALGYPRFAASAGDIGARVTAWLGARHPDRVVGVHLSSNALRSDVPAGADLDEDEAAWVAGCARWNEEEGGYMHVQQTKPLSLAYGLVQSPLALAAWILEKWHAWSDCGDDVVARFGEELADHLSLYWLTNSIATSFLPYYVHDFPPGARPNGRDIQVPVSFYLCPAENAGIPPRTFAERQFDIARWTELPRGGHFTATEMPDELAADIRAAFSARGS